MKVERKAMMLAIFNAYVLEGCHQPHEQAGHRRRDFLSFAMEVAHQLVGGFTARLRHAPHATTHEGRLEGRTHRPISSDSYGHRCQVCSDKVRYFVHRHGEGVLNTHSHSRTIFTCASPFCEGVHLCITKSSTCWYDWHYKKEYWR